MFVPKKLKPVRSTLTTMFASINWHWGLNKCYLAVNTQKLVRFYTLCASSVHPKGKQSGPVVELCEKINKTLKVENLKGLLYR